MRVSFGTARRLFVAFALLVSTFAVASYLTLAHVREIHDGLLAMKHHEEGVRLSLELASAVRDQYAHQAHTIILGDDSHGEYLTVLLQAHEGNVTRAAQQAGMERESLHRLLKRYGVHSDDFKNRGH